MRAKVCLISALLLTGACTATAASGQSRVTNGDLSFSRFDPALGDFSVWVADPNGAHQRRLVSTPSHASDWSPDGSRIAYDFATPTGDGHIATIAPDGTWNRQLTFEAGLQEIPRWSPDGRSIAYDASTKLPGQPGFQTDVWVMRADGSHPRQLTSGHFDVEPVFSPNGQQIAFGRITHDADVATEALYVMQADGSHLRQVVPPTFGLEHPDWSPDGRWLSFDIAPEASGPAVMAVHPDGHDLHVIRASDARLRLFKPAWSPDGQRFLVGCHDVRADLDRLCVMNADGRDLHVLVVAPVPLNSPAWGPRPPSS